MQIVLGGAVLKKST